jgi:hypothetical protein
MTDDERDARAECERRGIDPDADCAGGGETEPGGMVPVGRNRGRNTTRSHQECPQGDFTAQRSPKFMLATPLPARSDSAALAALIAS